MELYFLGTGAGMPSRERNVTSIVLNLVGERGTIWMFDCGEGTQHQILRSPIKLSRLEKLFITHLHGDHLYGLPGLLTSRSYHGGETPLSLYGPPGLRQYVEMTLSISQARLEYPLEIEEIGEGVVFEDDQFVVEAALLDHRIDSYGYRVTEKDQPGKLLADKLAALGIPAGPLYARLKKGEDVTTSDGRLLRSRDFTGAPVKGRVIVILGDTRVCDASRRLSRDADVLVHEATYDAGLQEQAHKYYHSTTEQAAEAARDCGVRHLILTHFSSRYRLEETEELIEAVRPIMPNVYAAKDLWSFPVPSNKPTD